MRRLVVTLLLGVGGLLLTPGAPGVPMVPGDPTPPFVTPVITGTLGSVGWYTTNVTVNWTVTDAESIILSTTGCDARTFTSDTVGTRLSCTATSDGGETTVAKTFKVDKTAPSASAAPSRAADANGWYNHELSVAFTGADGTSGLESCTPTQTYAGPDNAAFTIAGTCRDVAGNTAPASVPIKYDETSPSATPAARLPDANGWHNHSVTVTFQGADATSGVAGCTQTTYAGPDDPSVALSGTCVDQAGNTSPSRVFTLAYDETPPSATATASRNPNPAGWYTQPLTVTFGANDVTSGLESCDAPKTYAGPDVLSTAVAGTCRDRAGNASSPSVTLKYDGTAPQVAALPNRPANANGWHNAPLTVSFAGSDATSGIDSCDALRNYAGPDTTSVNIAGTCRDRAGNVGTGTLPLKYDTTPPATVATPSTTANAAGWRRAPFSVSFTGADVTSGVDAATGCDAAKSYSGPDTLDSSLAGACRDRAGNSTPASLQFKYDATAPSVTAAPSRLADVNGWYNHALSVTFTGGDAASGLESCDAAANYSGPDSSSVSIGGGCRDRAGNVGSGSVALRYDATGPVSSASPSVAPNANGWYRAPVNVTFSATDPVSGVASCPAAQRYAGPDTAAAVVSGTCVDNAGNGRAAALPLKYDATAPQAAAAPARAPSAHGWFNAPIEVGYQGADLMSGIDSCTAAQTYSGPDTGATSLSGSCRDRAGNASATAVYDLKYDATAPVVTQGVPVRAPDRGPWFNHPVAFAVQGTDVTSGIDACPATSYAGPDSASASFGAECLDKAGNRATKSIALAYDATGPEVAASPSRRPDSNGWYNHPLAVSFSGTDAVSGLESCAPPENYGGPDNGAAVVGGICIDAAGNAGVGSLEVRYDGTAPQITGATASRLPDRRGWYNHPVVVGFRGSDVTSNVEVCTQARYAGPDAGAVSIKGACVDYAGNASAVANFELRYDGTPPSLSQVTVKPGSETAIVSWKASPDTERVEVRRAGRVVYAGTARTFKDTRLKNGRRYRYTVVAYDEAGNAATVALAATPSAPLLSPTPGARVFGPPLLVWKAVPKASYYNVQLWRNGRRILSAWPKRTRFPMRRTWIYKGTRYQLSPGHYRWFVWPGYGRQAKKKFGPPLGSSTFVVR